MKKLIKKVYVSIILGLCVLVSMFSETKREEYSVKIDQVISTDYPNITAYTSIQNSKNEPVQGLAAGVFQSRIDSMEFKSKTTVTPFSMIQSPIDYTVIMSNNGIMDGEPLDFQKKAIIQLADLLKPSDSFSLYTIGQQAVTVLEEVKKEEIDTALINEIAVTSEQPRIYDSVINILRIVEKRKTERKVIILISDGRDQNSRFTKDQLHQVLSETGVPIYAVGIKVINTSSLSILNEMSDITGGTYFYASAHKTVPDTLKSINSLITQGYIIKYKVKNIKADNLPHHLEIAVDERDAFGKGQKAFIAIKIPVPKWVRWLIFGIVIFLILVLIFLSILSRIQMRRRMGITKRKCPDCGSKMKDSWDYCPFCKYLPNIKKKKKKGKKGEGK